MIIEELTPGAGSRNEPDIKRSPISESRAWVKLDRKSGADSMNDAQFVNFYAKEYQNLEELNFYNLIYHIIRTIYLKVK